MTETRCPHFSRRSTATTPSLFLMPHPDEMDGRGGAVDALESRDRKVMLDGSARIGRSDGPQFCGTSTASQLAATRCDTKTGGKDTQRMSEHGDRPPKSRRPYSRADHRARAHESAHTDAPLPPENTPDLPLVPKGPAPLLTTDDEVRELIDHCRAAGRFAYDSEFIGELTYHPKLCVLQVASDERVALIDPLADIDLMPFWELLADPAVEKIVHAGDQDIEPVVRHLNRSPANFFDTQIAAGFCGLPYPVSLSKLVGELTGARLGKGLTFTHWDQRPLSAMQLRYAADDVRYLPAVRAELGRRLEANGHTSWAKEECEALCEPSQY